MKVEDEEDLGLWEATNFDKGELGTAEATISIDFNSIIDRIIIIIETSHKVHNSLPQTVDNSPTSLEEFSKITYYFQILINYFDETHTHIHTYRQRN
jgi:hypothetical protein